MTYDHVVKHDGIYYAAGEMVPDDEVKAESTVSPFSSNDGDIETPAPAAKRGRQPKK